MMGTKFKTGLAIVCGMSVALMAGVVRAEGDAGKAKKETPANPVGADAKWDTKVDGGAPPAPIALTEKQTAIVKKVSGFFNALQSMNGAFVQTASDNKRMKGKFYVNRPGKFRFDYSLPSKQVIISDGTSLAIQDHDINTEDRYTLDQTPFRLLLRQDVDLARDANIVDVQEADGAITLTMADKDPDAPGKIKISFTTAPKLELKEWITTDAQGQDTRVEVSGLTFGTELDQKLFKIEAVGLGDQKMQ